MPVNVEKLKSMTPPAGMDFHITKLGHVVLQVADLERSTAFYTQVLGFKVSDVYPEDMMPGGMVFLRCNTDHHCLALVGAAAAQSANKELHHFAFEVPTLAEVIRARDRLRAHNVKIVAKNGKVTLRGPVASEDEKRAIEQKATEVAGTGNGGSCRRPYIACCWW